MAGNHLLSLANTLVTVGLVVSFVLLLNWFISTRHNGQPSGNLTPTPSMSTPIPASLTPTGNAVLPTQTVEGFPMVGYPAGTLAFVTSQDELGDLSLIHTGSLEQTKLFDDHLSLSLSPAWSPDGNLLAFVSTRDGNSEIYTVKANGTQWVRLTDDPAKDSDPAWSPDGKSIAFTSLRSGYNEVYVMDSDGSNVTQLTYSQAANTHPSWSPEGDFIAFATNRDGYWQIYRMNRDGSQLNKLSNNPAYDDQEPAWSPNGGRIAFASQQINLQDQEIYIMNSDGSGRTRLTGSISSADQATSDFSPAWSPDSQWIVFCSYRDNPVYGDLYIVLADTTEETPIPTRLTTTGGSQPAWKP
jgi:Tol biopolymer transport system component